MHATLWQLAIAPQVSWTDSNARLPQAARQALPNWVKSSDLESKCNAIRGCGLSWPMFLCRCLWDTKPRAFDSNSAAILSNFAELVVRELEMSAVMKMQLNMANMLKRAMDCYQQGYLFVDVSSPGWQILHVNQAFTKCTGVCATASLMCNAHAGLHSHVCCTCRSIPYSLACQLIQGREFPSYTLRPQLVHKCN